MSATIIPIPQPCHECGHAFSGAICNVCKVERPAYAALKNMTAAKRCRYYPHEQCACEQRGLCMEVA